jgi:hypothetical protein
MKTPDIDPPSGMMFCKANIDGSKICRRLPGNEISTVFRLFLTVQTLSFWISSQPSSTSSSHVTLLTRPFSQDHVTRPFYHQHTFSFR